MAYDCWTTGSDAQHSSFADLQPETVDHRTHNPKKNERNCLVVHLLQRAQIPSVKPTPPKMSLLNSTGL